MLVGYMHTKIFVTIRSEQYFHLIIRGFHVKRMCFCIAVAMETVS